MSANETSIINNALGYLGQSGINDSETGGSIASIARAIYKTAYPAALSRRPWTFALVTQRLAEYVRLEGKSDYSYSFALPTDPPFLFPYQIHPNQNYAIQDNRLLTESTDIYLTYCAKVDESKLKPYFVIYFEHTLAALLAMPVTQKIEKRSYYDKISESLYRLAASADSHQPNQQIKDGSIYQAFHRV